MIFIIHRESVSKIYYLPTIVLLLLLPVLHSQQSYIPTDIYWEYALWSKHNEWRSSVANGMFNQTSASNEQQLIYDNVLMQNITLEYALNCEYRKNTERNVQYSNTNISSMFTFNVENIEFGENIAYHSLADNEQMTFDIISDIIEDQWFNQYMYYSYASSSCSILDCTSYEQSIWANTRYIGCGVAFCPQLIIGNNNTQASNAIFIVCDYWPSFDSNSIAYESGIECNDCPSDRIECTNGLCSGCPNPIFYHCQNYWSFCDAFEQSDCADDGLLQTLCPLLCDDVCTDTVITDNCTIFPEVLIPPTSSPTSYLCSNKLGWYFFDEIFDLNISCLPNYALPTVEFIDANLLDECLSVNDSVLLDVFIPYPVNPTFLHGIAIEFPVRNSNLSCEWSPSITDSILTYTGRKCSDREQLFICIPDDYVFSTTVITTSLAANYSMVNLSIILPTVYPSMYPSELPSRMPSVFPTSNPTFVPTTVHPTIFPSSNPSIFPSLNPTFGPTTVHPTIFPSSYPTFDPTAVHPTIFPSMNPTFGPTVHPTLFPSLDPTLFPSSYPTFWPTTVHPTLIPSSYPTFGPTTVHPTLFPSSNPTHGPTTAHPTIFPSSDPSLFPSSYPTFGPTIFPSSNPTVIPSIFPSIQPITDPSFHPSINPSLNPLLPPSIIPSMHPSQSPTMIPSVEPTSLPTNSTLTPFEFFFIYPTYLSSNFANRRRNTRRLLSLKRKSMNKHRTQSKVEVAILKFYDPNQRSVNIPIDSSTDGFGYQFKIHAKDNHMNDTQIFSIQSLHYTLYSRDCNLKELAARNKSIRIYFYLWMIQNMNKTLIASNSKSDIFQFEILKEETPNFYQIQFVLSSNNLNVIQHYLSCNVEYLIEIDISDILYHCSDVGHVIRSIVHPNVYLSSARNNNIQERIKPDMFYISLKSIRFMHQTTKHNVGNSTEMIVHDKTMKIYPFWTQMSMKLHMLKI